MIRIAPDQSYIAMELEYTDPGRKVYGHDVIAFDGDDVLSSSVSGGEVTVGRFTITSFVPTKFGWIATFEGKGEDDGKPAELRFQWLLNKGKLAYSKEVRPKGAERFDARNTVRMTRPRK